MLSNPPAPECGDSDQGACVYVCESPEFQNCGPQKLGTLEASDVMIDGPLGVSDFMIDGPLEASDSMIDGPLEAPDFTIDNVFL